MAEGLFCDLQEPASVCRPRDPAPSCFAIVETDSVPTGTVSCLSITSNGALDDSARLQAALDLAGRSAVPLFLVGNFKVSQELTVGSGVRMQGEGTERVAIATDADGLPSLLALDRGATDIAIAGIDFETSVPLRTGLLNVKGLNRRISLDSVSFQGPTIASTMAGVAISGAGVQSLRIANTAFAMLPYGVNATSSAGDVAIVDSTFTGFTHAAIRFVNAPASQSTPIEKLLIQGNTFRDPRPGPSKYVIYINRVLGELARDVQVIGNNITGPALPWIRGAADSNNATADQIALQGVDGFLVADNQVTGGGEVGITVSRLSRAGIISGNLIEKNDGHGINVGSSTYTLLVVGGAFNIGDQLQGQTSQTTATVEKLAGSELFVREARNGVFLPGEVIHNLTTDFSYTISEVRRTGDITIINNRVFQNGQDRDFGNQPMAGVFVQNADDVCLENNRFFDIASDPKSQSYDVSLFHSRGIRLSPTNVFGGGKLGSLYKTATSQVVLEGCLRTTP